MFNNGDLIKEVKKISGIETQLDNNAINVKHPPSPLKSAKGDGVTNDSLALQEIFNYAGQHNRSVYFPDGIYFANSLSTASCKYIFGNGENSVIYSEGTGAILTVNDDKTTVSSLKFLGKNFDQIGVNIVYTFNTNIIDCTFRNLGLYGIHIEETGLGDRGSRDGAIVSRCHFYNCYRGIDVAKNGEYVVISDCNFQEFCGWAIWSVGGNTLIDSCNIVKCINGIYKGTVTNGGHSTITSCNINHIFNYTDNSIGYAIYFDGIDLGETVLGCSIFEAKIMVKKSKCINISNCQLSVNKYEFVDVINCDIHDSTIIDSYADTTNYITNTNSLVNWYNNKGLNGLYKYGIENLKGGQVLGTPIGQVLNNGNTGIVKFNCNTNTANNPNNPKYTDWWDNSTSKAKNKGFGGNKIQINAQIFVTFESGANLNATMCLLHVGTKIYALNSILFSNTGAYYTINSLINSEPDDLIYLELNNSSGANATITTTNGRLLIEGL